MTLAEKTFWAALLFTGQGMLGVGLWWLAPWAALVVFGLLGFWAGVKWLIQDAE